MPPGSAPVKSGKGDALDSSLGIDVAEQQRKFGEHPMAESSTMELIKQSKRSQNESSELDLQPQRRGIPKND